MLTESDRGGLRIIIILTGRRGGVVLNTLFKTPAANVVCREQLIALVKGVQMLPDARPDQYFIEHRRRGGAPHTAPTSARPRKHLHIVLGLLITRTQDSIDESCALIHAPQTPDAAKRTHNRAVPS